jgi:hypothetical protein
MYMTFFKRAPLALLVTLAVPSARSSCLPDGVQTSGAAYRICMPDSGKWNRGLVLYAHGYVSVNDPLGIPEGQLNLPGGTSIPALITSLGYGFAVSGYSVNGLAVQQGVADLADLAGIFSARIGPPKAIFILGPSEGGLVTALSVERYPHLYAGGMADCGPIGDFPAQVNYIGDFRVIFDYFFPGIIPGPADSVPPSVMAQWDAVYVPQIKAAVQANPAATDQLLKVTGAPVGIASSTKQDTIVDVLWYAVFSTNDAKVKLGGQPFDNSKRIYHGSSNDLLLNRSVARFTADSVAVQQMKSYYNTSGLLSKPLVTMHTTGDPIIPYWHEPLYTAKTLISGSAAKHIEYPVQAYGHCNFTTDQALKGFFTLIILAGGPYPLDPAGAVEP